MIPASVFGETGTLMPAPAAKQRESRRAAHVFSCGDSWNKNETCHGFARGSKAWLWHLLLCLPPPATPPCPPSWDLREAASACVPLRRPASGWAEKAENIRLPGLRAPCIYCAQWLSLPIFSQAFWGQALHDTCQEKKENLPLPLKKKISISENNNEEKLWKEKCHLDPLSNNEENIIIVYQSSIINKQ